VSKTPGLDCDESTVVVRLIGVPVALWKRTALHHEGVNREFEIIRAGLSDDAPPSRLQQLVMDLEGRFGDLSGGNREVLQSAFERGEVSVDLSFTVPIAAAELIGQLTESFDAVDEFCMEKQDLLSLASPPDMVQFRRWFLTEFTRQIEGLPPTPWRNGEEESDQAEPIVRFEGELDISSAERLRSAIGRHRTGTNGSITVDLSALTFVDSVGLSLLVMAHSSFQEEGRTMRIVLPEALRSLIELSGLVDVLRPEFVRD
jgi:anti-anti-sigma factor